MRTIGIDTNVLITLKLERQPGFAEAKSILKNCLAGKMSIFIPTAALLETEWVLRSYYKYQKDNIIEYFEELLAVDNITSESKDELKLALSIFKESKSVSFTDCVIIAQIQSRNYDFLTFDENLEKLHRSM